MTRDEVLIQLKQIISSEGFLEEEITMNSDLRVDLGMDSLDVVEMTIGIEERFFDCETIDEEVAERWKTVGDIVEYLAGIKERCK